jgi:putative tricarboxylic transport membrane protein
VDGKGPLCRLRREIDAGLESSRAPIAGKRKKGEKEENYPPVSAGSKVWNRKSFGHESIANRSVVEDPGVRNNDSVSGLFCLCLGLVFMGGGLKMGLGPWNAPGPGFFPAVIGAILSSLSGVLLVTASRKKGTPESGSFWKRKGSWRKILPSLLSLFFYLAFLDFLGYLLTTGLFILFLLKFVGKKRWGASILMAVIASAGSYALFRMGLGVLLPRGFLSFW